MIKDKDFYITYFSNKDQKLITRLGTLTESCKGYFTTKKDTVCFNYWDKTADGFRTATGQITVRYI